MPTRRQLFGAGLGTGEGSGYLSLLFACLSVFVAGGLPYGISALFPVMYTEGVLAEQRCGADKARVCMAERRSTKCCDAQMLSFTLLSSAGMLPSDALVAAYGEFVDRAGPRKTFALGMLMACCGLAMITANMWLLSEPLWFAAFVCLGSSGPGVFFSILFLTERYPRLQPLITSLSSATFDASAICFYFFNALYFLGGLRLGTISAIWLVICMLLATATYPMLPTWGWLKAERKRAKAAAAKAAGTTASVANTVGSPAATAGSKRPLTLATSSLIDGGLVSFGAPLLGERRKRSAPDGADGGGSPAPTVERASRAAELAPRTAPADDQSALSPSAKGSRGRGRLSEPLISPPGTPGTPAAGSLFRALQLTYYGVDGSIIGTPHAHVAAAPAAAAGPEDDALPVRTSGEMPTEIPPPPPPLTAASRASSNVSTGGDRVRLDLLTTMLRVDTLLLLLTMACANLRATYYIVSFSDELRSLFAEDTAQRLDTIFNIAFPVGALLTSPVASLLLRRFRTQPHVYMAIALGVQHLFGICVLLPHALPQAIGALLFGPARTLLWSSYFHYLAQPRRYPRALAGRTLGYSNLVIALLSDAPPYALNAFVEWSSGGDVALRARLYRWVHFAMQMLLVGCIAFPIHLYRTRHHADQPAQTDSTRSRSSSYDPPQPPMLHEADEMRDA